MQLPFSKMQGLGNDFMVLNLIRHPVDLSAEQVQGLADRHFGVGFDQLLMVAPPSLPDVDFDYRIFNADGSEVEHCGNGARCFARYVLDKGLIARTPIRVKTANRILSLDVDEDGQVIVDMGIPDFHPESLPFHATQQTSDYALDLELNGERQSVHFCAVSLGNPHCVVQVDDAEAAPVHELGAAIGSHPAFPQGVNVGFMQIVDRSTIRLRVFERGAGETIACGTGACAAVVCGIRNGLLDSRVRVRLDGGELLVHWPGGEHSIRMSGPATSVYEGTVVL